MTSNMLLIVDNKNLLILEKKEGWSISLMYTHSIMMHYQVITAYFLYNPSKTILSYGSIIHQQ